MQPPGKQRFWSSMILSTSWYHMHLYVFSVQMVWELHFPKAISRPKIVFLHLKKNVWENQLKSYHLIHVAGISLSIYLNTSAWYHDEHWDIEMEKQTWCDGYASSYIKHVH